MSIALQRFSNLIAEIHTAGTEPDRWDGVVREITDTFDAMHGFLVIADPAHGGVEVNSAGAITAAEVRKQLDAGAGRVNRLPVGATATGEELFGCGNGGGAAAVRANGLSNSFVARLTGDLPSSWLCLTMPDHGAVIDQPGGPVLLRVLVPHLRAALHTRAKLVGMARERAFALAALTKAHHGIMIVTADTTLVFANAAAERIARESDGLTVDSFGHLRAHSAHVQDRLRQLIDEATDSEFGGGNVAIARPSGKRSLILRISALDTQSGNGLWPRAALVVLTDPDHEPTPDPAVLHELYGLTDAEVSVALCVLRGDGLPAVADELSVSVYTARTHLQHIFAKTKTHRQAELVRLLSTTAISAQ
ncbi:helix-turn-helix transcriptional regulator [Nocardia sp. IBHARD005]|uniref:helix-turn-helix transcriptional regulator n=1 Tax=Nocardia sp. IBHARD005 TaxID=3457765 RepID=UPI004059FEBA